MEYKYKISIIIPFYNSESYLEEVIESIMKQTIGFKNIQLILVNDGSTDNSEEICLKYKAIYNNIVYLKQENSGVSSARNNGLKYVEGKYINFIDSDDKWSENALFEMYNFIEKNNNEIDFVSARIKCFEANEDYHFLDYKFEKTRVVDLKNEPDMIIMNVASSLFKSEAIRDKNFDVKIKVAEDSLFINTLLLDKLKCGVCREAIYYYRKRKTGNSTIQNISKSKSWYFDTPIYVWKKLIDESKKRYNNVIKYIQYILLYEMKWRINCQYTILNYLEVKKHLELIKDTIRYIDYNTIETYRLLDKSEVEILKKIKEDNKD